MSQFLAGAFFRVKKQPFIPQTVFTLEGFWRLVLGIGEVFAGGRAARRLSPNRVNYNTKWTLPLQNASEMVGRATLYWFLQ